MIKLIAIVDAKYGVAKQDKILWNFVDDLKFFRSKTMGFPIIMGSKTYFSLPHPPLDGRTNCVLSRHIEQLDGCFVFKSLEEAIKAYPDAWIIGGESVYNYALQNNFVRYALITLVHKDYKADQFINPEYLPSTHNKIFYSKDYEIREYLF